MTEELDRQMQQEEDEIDITDVEPHLFDLAACLVKYHRNAFEIRSQGFFTSADFDPPEVREMINFLQWCGDGFNVIDRLEQAMALGDIIKRSGKQINELIEEIQKYGITEQLAFEVNYKNAQMEAAHTLLGMLDDGN